MLIFKVGQIILSLILVGLVMLQSRGGGIGSSFGGSNVRYSSRKGLEKTIFYLTITVGVLFALVSLLNVLI